MKVELTGFANNAWDAVANNINWMSWNLFLALVPLALSVWLFTKPRSRKVIWWLGLFLLATFLPKSGLVLQYAINFIRDNRVNYIVLAIAAVLILLDLWLLRSERSRSIKWWLGFVVFIAFLPNAPYVLTDVIHLVYDIRTNDSIWIITLAIIPQYLFFIIAGLEAYVLSLINLGEYLQRQGLEKFILPTELTIHFLSAVGIYLGRFLRFNSWDIITELDNLANSITEDLTQTGPVLVMVVTFLVIWGLYWIMKQVSLGIILRRQLAVNNYQLPVANDH